MESTAVAERVERIAEACADDAADATTIEAALIAAREATAWIDAHQAVLVAKLEATASFPEAVIASAAKTSIAAAGRCRDRAATLAAVPNLAAALADGAITAQHIDAITRGSRQLPDDRRDDLFDRVESLAAVAEAGTIDQFRRRVDLEVRRLQSNDGVDRLERQRRNTRLSTWVDHDGMWNMHGRFDPVTGVRAASKLEHAVETLFAEQTPDGCPTDPVEKQRFLAARALIGLLDSSGGVPRPGRPEFVVVVDADAEPAADDRPGPVAQWSIPVEIPACVLAELAGTADVRAVVVRNGVVLHAPGELDLGRTTRLANRAQRRALRSLHRCCAIPGCDVRFDRCALHHVIWWRHGGRTDLANLIPVCSRHHTRIHHDGWVVELGPNRELTLRLPDGTVRATGPPGRRSAA
ncbi:MAG: DUF222 domain-containing protein [Ilumatobacteraceae bacterium]